jgi:chromosome segregation ATPase
VVKKEMNNNKAFLVIFLLAFLLPAIGISFLVRNSNAPDQTEKYASIPAYRNLEQRHNEVVDTVNNHNKAVDQLRDHMNQLSANLNKLNGELQNLKETIDSISSRVLMVESEPTPSTDPQSKKTIAALKGKIKKLESDINLFQYQRQHGGLK